jgi:hypothetical protein
MGDRQNANAIWVHDIMDAKRKNALNRTLRIPEFIRGLALGIVFNLHHGAIQFVQETLRPDRRDGFRKTRRSGMPRPSASDDTLRPASQPALRFRIHFLVRHPGRIRLVVKPLL